MGVTSGDTDADAPPITVTVSPFYMQQTETTKAQWDEVRTWAVSNGYTDLAAGAGKAANHPVHSVNWWDVVKWCNARSEKEGLTPVYTVGGAVMRTGATAPDALPKLAIKPNGAKQSSDLSQVSLPTESYTTFTPFPPVISFTLAWKSSFE